MVAAEGAAAVVVADLNEPGAKAVAEQIEARHRGVAMAVACNVGDDASVGALIEATEATAGPIDLFFANAGIGVGTDLETPDADWDLAFAVNVKAHYYASHPGTNRRAA